MGTILAVEGPASVAGTLALDLALDRPDLLAEPVRRALRTRHDAGDVFVAEIDPALADTAAFCERYQVGLGVSANCVIVTGKRADAERTAACVVLATTRADVNGFVRRRLDVRKASFLSMEAAVGATGMEYGGITPVGLPEGWPILVAGQVAAEPWVIIGSGIRGSKLVVPGEFLARTAHAGVHDELARPAP